MRHLTRRAAAACAACLAVVVPANAAFADEGGAAPGTAAGTAAATAGPATSVAVDNSAVSVDTTNNTSVFHLAFTVLRSSGPDVSVSNVALAVTDCTNCSAVAIAIQVDLVWPVPASLAAQNIAVAVTSGCATCDAVAAAFQYVIATNQPMTLTRQGRREIARIERQLRALQSAGLSPSALSAQVMALAAQLGDVLATQLVPARHDEGRDDREAPALAADGRHGDD